MASSFQLIVAEVILMLILVVYLVNYYRSPSVTWDVRIATYISWVLGFAGTILLPFDMAITLSHHDQNPYYHTLNSVWRTIYWRFIFTFSLLLFFYLLFLFILSTFALAWILLPIQLQYHMSGEFSFGRKVIFYFLSFHFFLSFCLSLFLFMNL